MKIKNLSQLNKTKDRADLLELARSGVESVMPEKIFKYCLSFDKDNKILKINNDKIKARGRIFIIGGGKASGEMAKNLEKIIGREQITAGVINTLENSKIGKIKLNKASHPLPNENGVRGVQEMIKLKSRHNINKNDLVICLISGGGSAMLPLPMPGLNLNDLQLANESLIHSGANINEINTVRKHLSAIKGGRLAEYFYPAKIVTLLISDVIGDDLSTIASGPTVSDDTTYGDAMRIIEKYKLKKKISGNVFSFLDRGQKGKSPETPKKLVNAKNYLIANNKKALDSIYQSALNKGMTPKVVTAHLFGETEEAAGKIASDIQKGKYKKYDCLILGGETTPTTKSKRGKGGRNQHFVLSFIEAIKDANIKWTIISLGSDGRDFIEGVAGAIADSNIYSTIQAKKINPRSFLNSFDSYNFFNKIGKSLIKSNNSHTNVGDIVIIKLS